MRNDYGENKLTIVNCDAKFCVNYKDGKCDRGELDMQERGHDVYVICTNTENIKKYTLD